MAKEKRPGGLQTSEPQKGVSALPADNTELARNGAQWQGKPQFSTDVYVGRPRNIAELLAEPGSEVMGYGADQRARGFWRFEDHAQRAPEVAAWAIIPADWLDAIDADSAAEIEGAARWAAWVRTLPDAWVIEVASGGNDARRHYWAYIASRHDRAQAWSIAETLGVSFRRGAGGRMRPIGSPHRSGVGCAEPIGITLDEIEPMLVAARLRSMPEGAPESVSAPIWAREPETDALESPRIDDLGSVDTSAWAEPKARREATTPNEDGSNDLWRLCLGAIEEGRTAEATFAEIMAKDSAARRWLTKRRENPRARFFRQWRHAGRSTDCPLIGTRTEALAMIDAQAAAIEQTPERWRGMGGASDRSVMVALYLLARRLGSIRFDRSVRQIAEDAGVAKSTAENALRRLCGADGLTPYLTKVRSKGPWKDGLPPATVWRINRVVRRPLQVRDTTTPHLSACPEYATNGLGLGMGADVWRWRGLGKNGARVLGFVSSCPDSGSRAVAEATGLHRATVHRILKKAAALGDDSRLKRVREAGSALAKRAGRCWSLLGGSVSEALGRFASLYGVAGLGEKQRERHASERKAFRDPDRPKPPPLPDGRILMVRPDGSVLNPRAEALAA